MSNINIEPQRPRLLSQEDIAESPFVSFSDYVSRDSSMPRFEELRQDTEPEDGLQGSTGGGKVGGFLAAIPRVGTVKEVREREEREEKRAWIGRLVTIILTFMLMVFVYISQQKWQQTLTQYLPTLPQITLPPNLPPNLLQIKQYQQIQHLKNNPPTPSPSPSSSPQQQQPHTMKYFVEKLNQVRKQAKTYIDIQDVRDIGELPFCLYVDVGEGEGEGEREREGEGRQGKVGEVLDSVLRSGYGNYVVLLPENTAIANIDSRIKRVLQKNHSYSYLKTTFLQTCPQNSLLLFLSSPIHPQSLHKLNTLHQTWNIYLTYSHPSSSTFPNNKNNNKNKAITQIHSFYLRVFQLLDLNDFDRSNEGELEKGNLQVMAVGMLELCVLKSKGVQVGVQRDQGVLSYLLVNANSQGEYVRTPYNGLTRLSQDFYLNLFHDNFHFQKMLKSAQVNKKSYIETAQLSITKILKATQLQDSLYLPKNHSLITQQLQTYTTLYSTSTPTSPTTTPQLPLCITILSHNNIAHNRYIKVMLSILGQVYSNYRIVFFDDMSEDQTLRETREFLGKRGFGRVSFIRNLERKYATYNILNAGFNFCGEDQIQVLMDGDDELIGRYVFALINSLYQKNPQKWVIYTNFKSNLYQFGESKPISQKQQIISSQNKRMPGHRLGQLRTFKVKLLRLIPKVYHQTRSGYWLDTVYDDALGHCLFELATIQRILYVPEICYQYNREYGDNDDSSQQKLTHRFGVYEYLLGLTPLNPVMVEDLGQVQANQEMVEIFKKEMKSNTFEVIKPILPQKP